MSSSQNKTNGIDLLETTTVSEINNKTLFYEKNRKFVVTKFMKLCDEFIRKQNEWD